MKNIFVLYTGGTIGMSSGSDGLQPDTALAGKALAPFAGRYRFDWHICRPLIDSSAVTVADWQSWLAVLAEKLPQYDGALVLHGTDTMAYTANVLALALQGLDKPVVMTGSQLPYDAPDSDAPLNLATAVAAFDLAVPEVAVAFNGKLFPAVGSSKVSTESAEGFDNPHHGILGRWTEQGGWQNLHRPSEKPNGGRLRVRLPDAQVKVVCATLVPGFSSTFWAEHLERSGADALVLQSYGHGNAPSDEAFADAIRRFVESGGLAVNISQVPQGNAAPVYAQGSALRRAGVIDGGKANLETAAALLTLAASERQNAGQVRQTLADLGLTPPH